MRLEWLRAVGRTSGPDFWRAADDATVWLSGRGVDMESLRREIAAARFSGTGTDVERVRRDLVEAISRAMPPKASSVPRRMGAIALAVAAIALLVWLGPSGGDPRLAARLRAADASARVGDSDQARTQWMALGR